MDAASETKKIAFDRVGSGETVLLISGFPQTRRSWNRLMPLLSPSFQTVAADLPSFGDSGILAAPATTENIPRVFHEFTANLSRLSSRCCPRKFHALSVTFLEVAGLDVMTFCYDSAFWGNLEELSC